MTYNTKAFGMYNKTFTVGPPCEHAIASKTLIPFVLSSNNLRKIHG